MAIITPGTFQFSPDSKVVGEKGLYMLQNPRDGSGTLHAAILLSRRVGSCLRDQSFFHGTEEKHLQGDDGIHLFNDAQTAFDDQLQYEEWCIRNAEKEAKNSHGPSQLEVIKKSRAEIDKFLGLDWRAEEARAWAELDKLIRTADCDWTNIPVQDFPFGAMVIDTEDQTQKIGKASIWRQDDGSLKIFYENPFFREIIPVKLVA